MKFIDYLNQIFCNKVNTCFKDLGGKTKKIERTHVQSPRKEETPQLLEKATGRPLFSPSCRILGQRDEILCSRSKVRSSQAF